MLAQLIAFAVGPLSGVPRCLSSGAMKGESQVRKILVAVIVGATLFSVGAFAASFDFGAEDVASGADAVTSCVDGTATVEWKIDASDAVDVSAESAAATFMITAADITAPGACAERDFRLAIQVGEAEVLCAGILGIGGLTTVSLSDCAPSGTVLVSEVTGAALLIGGEGIALEIV